MINFIDCVHARSLSAECVKCIDVCAYKALRLSDGKMEFSKNRCIECGACIGACPTMEAIQYAPQTSNASCKELKVCLAAFSSQDMVSLTLRFGELFLYTSECDACVMPQKIKKQIFQNADEANNFLTIIESKACIILATKDKQEAPQRRNAIKSLLGKGGFRPLGIELSITAEPNFEKLQIKDCEKLRQKSVPLARISILQELAKNKALDKRATFSFVKQKHIDDGCDNCAICYNLCPTEALKFDQKSSTILFALGFCISCGLCVDVCQKTAIHNLPEFELKKLYEVKYEKLFKPKRNICQACGAVFSFKGDLCEHCAAHEQDVMELSGAKNILEIWQ